MFIIAIQILLHSWARTVLTLLGIAFSFFLVTAQVGILVGWCNTTSAIITHASVDVWVMAEQNPAFDYGTAIPKQRLYQVRSVRGVQIADPIFLGWMLWQSPDGRKVNVELVGIDDGLIGAPWDMLKHDASVLMEPEAVIVDELYSNSLGATDIGTEVEMNEKRAVVRGISSGVRTFTAAPFVFTSITNAVDYSPWYDPDEITYVVARAAAGISPEQLRDLISAEVPSVQVLTTHDFVLKTCLYWMLETGVGTTVVVAAILGLVVGSAIVSQSLYALTNEHRKDYAALIAVGFSRWRLISGVLFQAALLGGMGIVLGSLAFEVVAIISSTSMVPIEMTPIIFASLCTIAMLACVTASLLSVRLILHADPISVFHV